MTLRKWITLVSAAGLIATVGACNDNKGTAGKTSPSATEPQGRSGALPSRATRADAGATDTATPSTPSSGSPSGGMAGSTSSSGSTSEIGRASCRERV